MSVLLEFLAGKRHDDRGRSLDEILALDDPTLERLHDYIQWLFPLREASAFNRDAPTLSRSDVEAMRMRPDVSGGISRALVRMMAFYGHPALDGLPWLSRHNHNYLRLTRILNCLRLAGLDADAERLYGWLSQLNARHPETIGAETFAYWTAAAGR